MTLKDFKMPEAKYTIVVEDSTTKDCFDAVPEKAIADIASEFRISNEKALELLSDSLMSGKEIICKSKKCTFWVEQIGNV